MVVRRDLTNIQKAVQSCHAAQEAGILFGGTGNPNHLVLLGVGSEEDIIALRDGLAEKYSIRSALFFEPDNDVGYSALATEPISGEKRRAFRGMEALRMD